LAPDLLGAYTAGLSAPAVIVSPRYVHGAPTVLEPVSRAQGVFLLAQNAFNFNDHGAAGLETLTTIARECESYTLVSCRLEEACDAVLGVLG